MLEPTAALEMDGSKILSGSQLVAKGASKKVDGLLPEVGLKYVSPTGSWLEQKQIQSALEDRKHLIAVERIEKSGSLSHAEWRDDLKVAEVTKKTGGYWQYIGFQRDNFLYLLPEEALFLLETNRLLLKHNDVTVSLQKAYSLCLKEIPTIQYKVYASLSRLGYRVSRHKEPTSDQSNGQNLNQETAQTATQNHPEADPSISMNLESTSVVSNSGSNKEVFEHDTDNTSNELPLNNTVKIISSKRKNDNSIAKTSDQSKEKTVSTLEITNNKISNVNTVSSMDIDVNANETVVISNDNEPNSQGAVVNPTVTERNGRTLAEVYSIDECGVIRVFEKDNHMEIDTADCDIDCTEPQNIVSSINDSYKHYQAEMNHYDDKIKKLIENKSYHARSNRALAAILDFHKLQEVKVNAPDENYLPRNIFLHKTEYTLNIDVIRTQNASNVNDETNSTRSLTPANNIDSERQRLPYTPYSNYNRRPRYRNYHHRRDHHYIPRMNFNYTYRPMSFYGPRYHPNSFVRQHMVYNVNMSRQNCNIQSNEAIKKYHYDMIVNIATRFKNGLALPAQIRALYSLLNTFNLRYNTRIVMTRDFNILGTPETETVPNQNVDENVITIDDEPKPKKPRLKDDTVKYNMNLGKLKELAAKLKVLHEKNLAVSRHRRVFSNAIKTFNKSFNADIHMDSDFVIVDRRTVVLDSSSDSDAVILKEEEKPKKRKKLRNPYNILKQMRHDLNDSAGTSQIPVLQTLSLNVINDSTSQYTKNNNNSNSPILVQDEDLLFSFYKSRFPGDNYFGGPKLCSRVKAHLDTIQFQMDWSDVLKNSLTEFESWMDIKLAILKEIRGSLNLQKQQVEALSKDFYTTGSQTQPILGLDCTDLESALKQLAIIPTNKEIPAETRITVHFDVCNRDVHFKKSDPPKPNFRLVCYDESAQFPSTEDVVALQAEYVDEVPLVFAFVGASSSISYLQISPMELPVFIPGKDLACE